MRATTPTIFSAATSNFGAAKNLVSATQSTAGVTKDPDCAIKGLAFVEKRVV